jgi:hypothetical protein
MNESTIFEWLLQLRPIGVALILGFAPALIARWKRRRMTPWYLYSLVCALLYQSSQQLTHGCPVALSNGHDLPGLVDQVFQA